MTQEEYQRLAIGDRVIRKDQPHTLYVLTNRVTWSDEAQAYVEDPNGKLIFHRPDARTRSGYADRALQFQPSELEHAPIKSAKPTRTP